MVARLASLFSEQRAHIDYFFDHLDEAGADQLIAAMTACTGSIILSGVGKSAFVAERLGRMLLSIGVRAHFLAPTEALHGDLGAIGPDDLAIFFSKSGASDELVALAPHVRRRCSKLIALVCRAGSPLEGLADQTLLLPLERELCPFDLAPTTSSAVQLLFGDVCLVALMERRGFSESDYAINHPAGAIGKQLSLRVADLMLTGDGLPKARVDAPLLESLVVLSQKGCGCLLVTEGGRLAGIFTDGDLRRTLQEHAVDLAALRLGDVMSQGPKTIDAESLAIDALRLMQEVPGHFITELPVVGAQGELVGLIRMHQIVSQGIHA